jgi:rhodanese-related sulfurtransferase
LKAEGKTSVLVLFPENERQDESYLNELGISISDVSYASLDSLGIRNTPMLAILNRDGVVTRMWVGKLPPRSQTLVMKELNVDDPRSPREWLLDEPAFRTLTASGQPLVLLDVRDRAAFSLAHKEGARNIPVDELRVRAVNELSSTDAIVLYGDETETDLAYTILDVEGFSKISIMAGGSAQQSYQRPQESPGSTVRTPH